MRKSARTVLIALALAAAATALPAARLPQDRGAAGTWQKLLKLRTTASVMHTTAHPDDEHGGRAGVAQPRRRARGSRS